MENLYFVTSNQSKAEEARMILEMPVEIRKADLIEIQSLNLEEIVRDKARQAFEMVGEPVIVDDVGFFLEAWNGFPGPFVKYILDTVGKEGILKMLEGEENRSVVVKAVIGFHDGKEIHTFVGEVRGVVASEARGDNGFGWDSIFIPESSDKTYAQMSLKEKSGISHRRVALEKFKQFLKAKNK